MTDIFALRDSRLNVFLFSDVGLQTNGNGLTILSLLSRLGKDPWAEAAAWAGKPRDAAIRSLTDSISQMPLSREAFADAHQTASRLIDLLPRPATKTAKVNDRIPAALAAIPKGVWRVVFYAVLFAAFSCWLTWGA